MNDEMTNEPKENTPEITDGNPVDEPQFIFGPGPTESRQFNLIAAALAKAQAKFGPIPRTKVVTVRPRDASKAPYQFSYASLDVIKAAIQPALSENSLCTTQGVVIADGKQWMRTRLIHSSGQWLANYVPIFVDGTGSQAYGSAQSYARRYGITMLVDIASEDDDDGNAGDGNQATFNDTADASGGPIVHEGMKEAKSVRDLNQVMGKLPPGEQKRYMPYFKIRRAELAQVKEES